MKLANNIGCWMRGHLWQISQSNSGHRHCTRCGRRDMLFHNRFPAVGEPAYQWHPVGQDMRRLATKEPSHDR